MTNKLNELCMCCNGTDTERDPDSHNLLWCYDCNDWGEELTEVMQNAQQERINRYVEQTPRPLSNGRVKNTLTGEQHEADEHFSDLHDDLPGSNRV